MDNQKIQEKLKKIKELAERGIGGEKEGARQLYEKLLLKYGLTDSDIDDKIVTHWFRFSDELDKKLLTQIFYKVTGSRTYWTKKDKRVNLVGCECTEFECDEIIFYYQFYKEHLQDELDIFLSAFMSKNNLYPDSNARVHEEDDEDNMEDINLHKLEKIRAMADGIDRKTPALQIEKKQNQ